MEYLTQLLGEPTATILAFVENVAKFKNGEPISTSTSNINDNSKPREETSKATPKPDPVGSPSKPPSKLPVVAPQSGRNLKQKKSKVPPPKNFTKDPALAKSGTVNLSGAADGNVDATAAASAPQIPQEPAERKVEKLRPTRGKAKRECGCFGTYHKPLTNCLHCGRISCNEEGYDFCPFCGYLVEELVDDGQE